MNNQNQLSLSSVLLRSVSTQEQRELMLHTLRAFRESIKPILGGVSHPMVDELNRTEVVLEGLQQIRFCSHPTGSKWEEEARHRQSVPRQQPIHIRRQTYPQAQVPAMPGYTMMEGWEGFLPNIPNNIFDFATARAPRPIKFSLTTDTPYLTMYNDWDMDSATLTTPPEDRPTNALYKINAAITSITANCIWTDEGPFKLDANDLSTVKNSLLLLLSETDLSLDAILDKADRAVINKVGYFAIFLVVSGREQGAYVVSADYLSSPAFLKFMERKQEEFGGANAKPEGAYQGFRQPETTPPTATGNVTPYRGAFGRNFQSTSIESQPEPATKLDEKTASMKDSITINDHGYYVKSNSVVDRVNAVVDHSQPAECIIKIDIPSTRKRVHYTMNGETSLTVADGLSVLLSLKTTDYLKFINAVSSDAAQASLNKRLKDVVLDCYSIGEHRFVFVILNKWDGDKGDARNFLLTAEDFASAISTFNTLKEQSE